MSGIPGPLEAPDKRWSLGGVAVVEIAAGSLSVGTLIVESDSARLDASLTAVALPARKSVQRLVNFAAQMMHLKHPIFRSAWSIPNLADLTITDDLGKSYRCRIAMASRGRQISGDATAPIDMCLLLDPEP